MSTPDDAPQPQQPGSQPPQPGNVPPAGYQPPQPGNAPPAGYQPPQPGNAPPAGYQPPQPGNAPPSGYPGQQGYQPPPGYQQQGQPAYGPPAGPNPAPPAGLGYAAPPRNVFGLDNRIAYRFRDTTGVPQPMVVSYWLWIAAAVLGVLASIVNIFQLRDIFGGLMVGAGVASLVLSLLIAAVYMFMAIRLKEGSRWARLVLTILGVLAAFSLLFQLITLNFSLIGSAAAVAAAVMMWLPESQKHFV
ncbi:hypothetical protein ACFRJ9_15200 [Paenarthrobacter sp. NPDC056912]|uniref:DUF5336 domain-containing protein n=1 Tax=Paenarthrobacter sp. NPDC056912 TaxID=3345965 RepID=UPI003670C8D0